MDQQFCKGLNIGGWLSQCPHTEEHYGTFINEGDIQRIAAWGFDHIRLPFDCQLVEDDAAPGQYKEDGFVHIDNCLQWCADAGLNVILDMHAAPGYYFFANQNTLFDDPAMQQRFVALWQVIALRYRSLGGSVRFELLNEVVEPDSSRWNALYPRVIEAIRRIDPHRVIVVGCNRYSAAAELKNLTLVDDVRVAYTVHFYEPYVFTHQRIKWVDILRDYDTALSYPGVVAGIAEFIEKFPQYEYARALQDLPMNRATMFAQLEDAAQFQQQHKRTVYLGEFGVIEGVDEASRDAWISDVLDFCREHGIGYALWSYKAMDFGLVTQQGDVISEKLVRLLVEG